MFERFTPAAREVVVSAQREAVALQHDHVSSAHLLLALVRAGSDSTERLAACNVPMGQLRAALSVRGTEVAASGAKVPFTPDAKRALELALREALQLGDNHIGEHHLLLSLLRLTDGDAHAALESVGADRPAIRAAILREFGPEGEPVRFEPRFRPRLTFRLAEEGVEVDVSEVFRELVSHIQRLEAQVDRLTAAVERLERGGPASP